MIIPARGVPWHTQSHLNHTDPHCTHSPPNPSSHSLQFLCHKTLGPSATPSTHKPRVSLQPSRPDPVFPCNHPQTGFVLQSSPYPETPTWHWSPVPKLQVPSAAPCHHPRSHCSTNPHPQTPLCVTANPPNLGDHCTSHPFQTQVLGLTAVPQNPAHRCKPQNPRPQCGPSQNSDRPTVPARSLSIWGFTAVPPYTPNPGTPSTSPTLQVSLQPLRRSHPGSQALLEPPLLHAPQPPPAAPRRPGRPSALPSRARPRARPPPAPLPCTC